MLLDHGLAKDLRWTFRFETDRSEHLEFNVECVPRRSLGIDDAVLSDAGKEAGLLGGARIDGDRLVYSLPIGHESKAHELCEGGMLANNLRGFAVDAMMAMLRVLDRYGRQPVIRSIAVPSAGQASVNESAVTDQLRLALEAYLEDLIIEQWSKIDFGAHLSYVDRQMKCGHIGMLDILARDRATNGFVVLELKRDKGDDEVFGQVCRYMGWVAENMHQPQGVPVTGIIIAAEVSPKLKAAARTNPNVRLVEYAIRLELRPTQVDDAETTQPPEQTGGCDG